ncbi:MarR family winged helix-turn-helix transcriptional regulator [Metabacillus malikii]|uniref:DNA-binding MarR family transcriptional regulator n=1 Tax=Metabacillus malikii TaxID=1504265 RepID=A0ABT9ZFB6_9BACI|nr:MarR family transcriptional regulator [Metabacillus malikii]MDQ0230965.1 DNA-binding MarR family transcriptional regulator [Metabacillus malikii]
MKNKLEISKDQTVVSLEKSLRHITGILKQKGRGILSDYGITPPQFAALQWLWEDGDLTIGELSNKLFLACSTTTDLIDRMEKNKLVLRVRNPKDRRVVRIHLLEEGERVIEEVVEKRQQYLNTILTNFEDEELKVLAKSIMKLQQEMKEK